MKHPSAFEGNIFIFYLLKWDHYFPQHIYDITISLRKKSSLKPLFLSKTRFEMVHIKISKP